MHDGTLQQGDQWLQNNMNGYIQWAKTHNSLLIFTFDEDDSSNGGSQYPIPTLIVGQGVIPGVYNEAVNHFSVLRTIEDMYHLPYAGAAATAVPITDIFATSSGTPATTAWQLNATRGNWSGSGNWGPGAQYPNANTFKVSLNLSSTTTGPAAASVNINVDVADARCENLAFDQVAGAISNYTVSGVNPLTMEAGSYVPYGSQMAAIVVPAGNSGANAISAPLRISTSGDTTGLVIDNNGTGGLTVSGPITYDASAGTQSRSLIVQGSGVTTISGSIDGQIVATLTKAGDGILYLTAPSSHAGSTTVNGGTLSLSGAGTILDSSSIIVNGGDGGMLLLDNSAGTVAGRVGSDTGITLNGGTFALLGSSSGASSQSVGVLTLGPGASTVAISGGGSASCNATLTFGSENTWSGPLRRTAGSGSMVNFTTQIIGQGGPGGSDGGGDRVLFAAAASIDMPAAWIVVNGHDFARYDSSQGMTEMAGAGATRYGNLGSAPANGNVLIQSAVQTILTTSNTINSLVVQSAGSQVTTLNGNVTLNIANTSAGALDSNGGIVVSGSADFVPSGGYTINGGTITSGVAGVNSELFAWIDSGTTTINSAIADIGGGARTSLALGGAGTLVLGGINTFSGGTFINSGVLQPASANAMGAAGSAVTVRAGGVLDLNGQALGSNNYQIFVVGVGAGAGAIINSGAAQSNALGSITLGGDTALGGENAWSLQAVAGGPATVLGNGFNLTKTGANTIAIAGQLAAASVSGVQNINITQGTLALTGNTVVDNSVPGDICVNSGAVLSVGNWGATPGVSIAKPLVMAGGTLQTDSGGRNGNATITADISLNAMPTLNATLQTCPIASMAAANIFAQGGSTLTLSGVISDGAAANSILLLGGGTVVIAGSGANTYSGDTIANAGVLNVQKSQGLGSGGVSVAAGAELQLQGNITLSNPMLALSGSGAGPGVTGALQNASGNNVFNGDISLGYGALTGSTTAGVDVYAPVSTCILSDSGTLTINGSILGAANNDQLIFGGGGNCIVDGEIAGGGSLVKVGTGSLVLSGSNSYAGGTVIEAGTLIATDPLPSDDCLSVSAGGAFVFDPSASETSLAVSPGVSVVAVPEPSTFALLGVGLVGLGAYLGVRKGLLRDVKVGFNGYRFTGGWSATWGSLGTNS
jgi:autotransporter-associated beta strand protein